MATRLTVLNYINRSYKLPLLSRRTQNNGTSAYECLKLSADEPHALYCSQFAHCMMYEFDTIHIAYSVGE